MKRLLIAALCIATHLVAADPRDIAFKSSLDGSEQAYVELLPPGFDSTKGHDVVFAFHGHGSDRWQGVSVCDCWCWHGDLAYDCRSGLPVDWLGHVGHDGQLQFGSGVQPLNAR